MLTRPSLGFVSPTTSLRRAQTSHIGICWKIITSVIQVGRKTPCREPCLLTALGMNFIELLLGQNPGARMTPAQALLHPWIKEEGARQRARSQEQDQTLSRDDVRRPSSPKTDISTGDSQSKKQKFSFLHPEETLATVSVGGDTYEAGAKRTRFQQPTVQREPAHLADFGDEIPGLGLYCG